MLRKKTVCFHLDKNILLTDRAAALEPSYHIITSMKRQFNKVMQISRGLWWGVISYSYQEKQVKYSTNPGIQYQFCSILSSRKLFPPKGTTICSNYSNASSLEPSDRLSDSENRVIESLSPITRNNLIFLRDRAWTACYRAEESISQSLWPYPTFLMCFSLLDQSLFIAPQAPESLLESLETHLNTLEGKKPWVVQYISNLFCL